MNFRKSFKTSSSRINVIYDLLHLFVFDPHIDIVDAKWLLKEIARSLRMLSKDRLVLVSFDHCDNEFKKFLLTVLDKRIEIKKDFGNGRILQMNVYNRSFKGKEESSCAALRNETLMLMPSR